jgi:3-methylcrotonyl-CoA carboxylase alpha subunit
MDKILHAAKITGAQGIHPGYGFLSENARFADACADAGIIFIGPPASAIRDMGSKSASKHIMSAANVPIIEGYHGEEQAPERLRTEAERIGYPVLLKAVSGGGGKGMRIVEAPADFDSALESAKREALKSFSDDTMLVEKYVQRPRHVEVQVFCDRHGNAFYLYERDCSVQRRHQKIIEEAPAPGLSDETRRQLGEAAVRAARAVNYVGAGTVEFIMDPRQQFFFMEMNTRLQVEHPITEMITGVDLVEWQLLAASGFPINRKQEDIRINGSSFEARIYAENPSKNFLPGAGPLLRLSFPPENATTRVETGVREGDVVSVFYDPMIAKLVVWGENRTTSLRRLDSILAQCHVSGLSTNVAFLRSLANHPSFQAGDVHTGFIEQHRSTLFREQEGRDHESLVQLAVTALLTDVALAKPAVSGPWGTLAGFRVNGTAKYGVQLQLSESEVATVQIEQVGSGEFLVTTPGAGKSASRVQARLVDGGKSIEVTVDGHFQLASVHRVGASLKLYRGRSQVEASVELASPKWVTSSLAADASSTVAAPMNGRVVRVDAKPGAEVKKGDVLVIMEAMKMEVCLTCAVMRVRAHACARLSTFCVPRLPAGWRRSTAALATR